MSLCRTPRRYDALPSTPRSAGDTGQTESARASATQRRKPHAVSIGPRRAGATCPTNLPAPLTSFIGREDELARLRTTLRGPGSRLITLIGPVGCGKSRLAVEATASLIESFPDGIVWVSLAASTAQDAADAIVRAIEDVTGMRLTAVARLLEYDAVHLFVDRAASVGFALTAENASAVASICRRLEGNPFAIERAALAMRLLSPQELDTLLTDTLRVLDDPLDSGSGEGLGQWAAIERDYTALSGNEQRLFRRLSVFKGGATFDAVMTALR